ncbi:MAG: A24 family peptidase, partial [Ectothiorhodospiraceae bacterium]
TGKEGMGYGDFKLFAALGAWLGWQALPVIILLASLVGAATGIAMIVALGRDRQLPIPFGPYLAAAGWLTLLWQDDFITAYLQWAGLA